jgi:hypothetical protein
MLRKSLIRLRKVQSPKSARLHKDLYFVFVRGNSCDFVDRMTPIVAEQDPRNDTKSHERTQPAAYSDFGLWTLDLNRLPVVDSARFHHI